MWMVLNGKGTMNPRRAWASQQRRRTLRNGKGMKNPRSEHRAVRLELHVVRHGPLACRPTIHVGMHRSPQLLENSGVRMAPEGRRSPARARARVMARADGRALEEVEVQGKVAAVVFGGLREAKEAVAESEVELQWRAAVAASQIAEPFVEVH